MHNAAGHGIDPIEHRSGCSAGGSPRLEGSSCHKFPLPRFRRCQTEQRCLFRALTPCPHPNSSGASMAAPAGPAPAAATAPPPAPPPRAGPAPPCPRGRACALAAMAAGALRGVLWPRAAAGLRAARAALAAPSGARAGERGEGGWSEGPVAGPGCLGRRAGGGGVGARGRRDLPGLAGAAGGARAHGAALLSRSLGDVQGHDARAVSAHSGGAGSRREEVQHAGGGLSALPRRRLRVSWVVVPRFRSRERAGTSSSCLVGRCCRLVVPGEHLSLLCRAVLSFEKTRVL